MKETPAISVPQSPEDFSDHDLIFLLETSANVWFSSQSLRALQELILRYRKAKNELKARKANVESFDEV